MSGSKNVEYADFVRNYEVQHKCNVLKLQTGDPDFSTPEVIQASLVKSLSSGKTHYTNSQGIPELRKAIAQKLKNENNITSTLDEVIVTNGGIQGVSLAVNAIINPGDKALIIEPYWMPYYSILTAAGAEVSKVSIDLESYSEKNLLEKFLKIYSDDFRIVIVNSPSNPTGIVFSEDFIRSILNRISLNTFLLSDEVYEKIIYDQAKHVSPASLGIKANQVISVFSFSKTFAMTGFRVGYVHANQKIIIEMLKLFQFSSTCIAPFIQEACVTALCDDDIHNDVNRMVKKYAERREQLKKLKGVSLPSGAFYSFIKIPDKFQMNNFPYWIVREKGISVSPGDAFGDYPGYFRISFAVDDDVWLAALDQLVDILQK